MEQPRSWWLEPSPLPDEFNSRRSDRPNTAEAKKGVAPAGSSCARRHHHSAPCRLTGSSSSEAAKPLSASVESKPRMFGRMRAYEDWVVVDISIRREDLVKQSEDSRKCA